MAQNETRELPGVITSGWPVIAKITSNSIQLVIAFVGSVLAILSIWNNGLTLTEVASFFLFYTASGIGVGVCMHRLFTHRSYEAPNWFRWIAGAFGSIAFQGSLLRWVADHRRHHARADMPGDPHSPYFDAKGRPINSRLRGFIHAHFGWFVDWSTTDNAVYAKGLMDDPVIRFYTHTYWFWVAMSLFLPWLFGYYVGGSLDMAWRCLLIGGCLRITVLYHVTWSVNSVTHMFGSRPFGETKATNFGPLAPATFGEAWHNNHHEYPRAVRHGIYPGQLDINGLIIEGLAKIGIAKNLVYAPVDKVEAARPGGSAQPVPAE